MLRGECSTTTAKWGRPPRLCSSMSITSSRSTTHTATLLEMPCWRPSRVRCTTTVAAAGTKSVAGVVKNSLSYSRGSTVDEARAIAERMRLAVAGLAVPYAAMTDEMTETVSGITISAGIAASPTHGCTLESLYNDADAALYRAKQGGRNRMLCSPLTSGPPTNSPAVAVPGLRYRSRRMTWTVPSRTGRGGRQTLSSVASPPRPESVFDHAVMLPATDRPRSVRVPRYGGKGNASELCRACRLPARRDHRLPRARDRLGPAVAGRVLMVVHSVEMVNCGCLRPGRRGRRWWVSAVAGSSRLR